MPLGRVSRLRRYGFAACPPSPPLLRAASTARTRRAGLTGDAPPALWKETDLKEKPGGAERKADSFRQESESSITAGKRGFGMTTMAREIDFSGTGRWGILGAKWGGVAWSAPDG